MITQQTLTAQQTIRNLARTAMPHLSPEQQARLDWLSTRRSYGSSQLVSFLFYIQESGLLTWNEVPEADKQ